MALKVIELVELQGLQGMKLISGETGLERIVCSCGIMDYEFDEGVEYYNDNAFEPDSFVISSLLFAQGHPERILPAVMKLYEAGTSAFAFKDVIFKMLPEEVLDFSKEKGYPIFMFGQDLYFENIIYEIMDAVERDNTEILSEQSIRHMIENDISKLEVTRICRGVSLVFKSYAMGVYLREKNKEQALDTGRILRNYYLSKTLKGKCLVSKYDQGIFILLTGSTDDEDIFDVILKEALEGLAVDRENCYICRSGIYSPFTHLDLCFRESYHAYAASLIGRREYSRYKEIGVFQYLVPLKDSSAMQQYARNYLQPIMSKEELFSTACIFVKHNGDIAETAAECSCHQNTIRYRIAKMKELAGAGEKTEFEFYAELSVAVRVYLLKEKLR